MEIKANKTRNEERPRQWVEYNYYAASAAAAAAADDDDIYNDYNIKSNWLQMTLMTKWSRRTQSKSSKVASLGEMLKRGAAPAPEYPFLHDQKLKTSLTIK